MKLKDIIVLIGALLLAIGVAYLTRLFLMDEEKTRPSELIEKVPQKQVLVAAKELAVGTIIKRGDLSWHTWPENALHQRYILKGTVDIASFDGVIVKDPLEHGEPVLRTSVVNPKDKGVLAAILEPGMRAVAINITPQSSLSGLIEPGDRVDVIVAKRPVGSEAGAAAQSVTVLKNIRVLAMDVTLTNEPSNKKDIPRVATLEVTPAQAELLTAAEKEGTLSLSLHSLVGGGSPVQGSSDDQKIDQVLLIRGAQKQIINIQE